MALINTADILANQTNFYMTMELACQLVILYSQSRQDPKARSSVTILVALLRNSCTGMAAVLTIAIPLYNKELKEVSPFAIILVPSLITYMRTGLVLQSANSL